MPRGYNVSYRQFGSETPLESVSIEDHNANSFVLEGLEEFTLYQVLVQAYNDVGTSLPSPVATERTREASQWPLFFCLFPPKPKKNKTKNKQNETVVEWFCSSQRRPENGDGRRHVVDDDRRALERRRAAPPQRHHRRLQGEPPDRLLERICILIVVVPIVIFVRDGSNRFQHYL